MPLSGSSSWEEAQRSWPRRIGRALLIGARETVVLMAVLLVASWSITTFGPSLVSRPGASAQVILPDLWPILRVVLPLYFMVKTVRELLRG